MGAHDPGLLDILFDHGLDVRARRIFLHGELEDEDCDVGDSIAEKVSKALLYLDKTPGTIELWINTPGGSVTEMFALYDIIRTRENPVTTVGLGEICSAGCLILTAGDRRLAMPSAWFMWHRMSTGAHLPFAEARARIEASERFASRWCALMEARTKRKAATWMKHAESGELWLSAKQMVQYGVVDEVIQETHQ